MLVQARQEMKPQIAVLFTCAFFAFTERLEAVEFETDILPIFSSRCGKCHLDGSSKGGLSLDLDRISREIGSGKAIVPGESAESELMELIQLPEDDDDRMPPKGRPLAEREITMIREWIDGGARVGTEAEAEPKMADVTTGREEEEKMETWSDTEGRTLTASILRVDAPRRLVVLKLEDGTMAEVPIARLSEESRARAKEFWDASRR